MYNYISALCDAAVTNPFATFSFDQLHSAEPFSKYLLMLCTIRVYLPSISFATCFMLTIIMSILIRII